MPMPTFWFWEKLFNEKNNISNTNKANNVIDKIKQICKKENVGKIVLGESLDFAGKCNDIMEETDFFKVRIEKGTGLPVVYENETMTTAAASRIQGVTDKIDASAAARILKGYLDKEKNKK